MTRETGIEQAAQFGISAVMHRLKAVQISGCTFNWDNCHRKYKDIGKHGTHQNVCLNLTHKKQCEFYPYKCDAKSYKR